MNSRPPDGARRSGSFGPGSIQPQAVLDSPIRAPSSNQDGTAASGWMVARGSSNSNNNNRRRQPQKTKRVACKECRQAKLRCVGLKDGEGPCIRCRRLSLSCQIDTSYKRVNKRLKINEIVEELEHLRSVVGERNGGNQPSYPLQRSHTASEYQSPPSLLSPASLVLDPNTRFQRGSQDFQSQDEEVVNTAAHSLQTWGTGASHSLPPSENQQVSFTTSSSQRLENIELKGSQVDDLFRAFFNHYHHFLEILDPATTPDIYHERSPVLFWAIISVASRRYEDDVTLLGSLNPSVTRLIWSSVSQPPLPSPTIQALLLLSMWPFPFDSQSRDPSLLMISVAKNAAMQNGLHRPEIMQDFVRVKTQLKPEEFHAAVKLWAGCCIAAESVTTSAGQPSLFSNDWATNRACETGNDYTVPTNLRYHLLVQKFLARVDNAMERRTCSPIGQPVQKDCDGLMRLLECDLEDLEMHIGNEAEGVHRIALAMVSMQLSTYYFFDSSASEMRKQGLLRAYNTALNFISKIADEDMKNDFIKYVPNVFCLMLITAGMLVMKIICSSYAKYVDIEGGSVPSTPY